MSTSNISNTMKFISSSSAIKMVYLSFFSEVFSFSFVISAVIFDKDYRTDEETEIEKDELKKVKHTHVQCEILDHSPVDVNYTLEEAEVIVASERIDGVLAALLKLSRSQCVELFREKKVFVNSRLMENNAHILKVGDIFSVRGYGKFIYDGILATTKKDKFRLGYRKYC
ncbi:MAG: hypothetical protein HGA25_03945 [Clostridiales bacterium]|nr:hypothetical protein [Clostridiales bacterium]